MKNLKSLILIGSCATCGLAAYAGQPPDVVKSDSCSNTAMGTGVMFDYTNCFSSGDVGENTAAGYSAMYFITDATRNTAFGANTMSGPGLSGTGNSAFGDWALSNITSGNYNTAIGVDSLPVP